MPEIDLLQENLKLIRRSAGWTIEELANKIGVTKQTIINLEGLKSKMTKTTYIAIRALLSECKNNGIHTAIETTGDTDWEKIEKVQDKIDLFLYDMKHIDPEKLKEVPKGNGNRILSNLKKLASLCPEKIIIRVPVIPSFNYDEDTINGIINFAIDNKIKEVNLLPYHNLGKSKYEHLGLTYPMGDIPMLKKEELLKYARNDEILVKIGG